MLKEGGASGSDATYRLMAKLATDDVLAKVNRTGTCGKARFPVSLEKEIIGWSTFGFKNTM